MRGGASHNLVEGNYIYNLNNEKGEKIGYQKNGVIIASPTEVGNCVINNIAHNLTAGGQPVVDGGTETVIVGSQYGTGNIGIGTSQPNASALLEVNSASKGFLPPRMTTSQRDAISNPPEGLMIYNMSTHKMNYYDGSKWVYSGDR